MSKMISLYHIQKVGLTNWRNKEWWDKQMVNIWSNEHGGWWRPNAEGYTSIRSEAWVIDFPTAYERTEHCGPEKKISFCALPQTHGSE